MPLIAQPQSRVLVPDLTDPTLVGAWLNHKAPTGNDYSGAGNDMTPVGGCVLGDGSAVLDGTTGYLSAGNIAAMRFTTNDEFTVCAWIKPNLDDSGYVVSKFSNSGTGWGVFCTLGRAITVYADASQATGTAWATAGTWSRVCVAVTGMSHQIYGNGSPQGVPLVLSTRTADSNVVRIGNRNGVAVAGTLFAGSLLDVRIYSRVLSASEIADDFARGVPEGDRS